MLNMSMIGNLTFGCTDPSTEDFARVECILKELKMYRALELLADEAKGLSADELGWLTQLTYTERVKIHLARALIMNPEVLVLQRPLHHYDTATRMAVLDVLKLNVSNRGVGMPQATASRRRPRTVFFTPEAVEEAEEADDVWQIDMDRKEVFVTSKAKLTPSFDLPKPPPTPRLCALSPMG